VDVVLADLRDREVDDIDAYRGLVADCGLESDRLVVITVRDGQLASRLSEAGVRHHLFTPVFPYELLEALMERVEEGDGARAAQPSSHSVGRRVRQGAGKALLVEDNRVNRMLAETLLKRRGYDVVTAENGVEALAEMERGEFDFVLMDVQMPEMDGLEATRRIRALEGSRERRIPIIAVTAHSMKGDRERCLAAGMDDYVVKPIDPERLDAAIARCFPHITPVFEHARALDLAFGDESLLRSIVRVFLDSAPERLAAIHDALERGDSSVLGKTAHTLEGAAQRLAMPRLRDLAHRVAVLSQRGDFEGARALEAELRVALDQGRASVLESIDVA
jgi:CheY-like chemotaxis protein